MFHVKHLQGACCGVWRDFELFAGLVWVFVDLKVYYVENICIWCVFVIGFLFVVGVVSRETSVFL